METPSADPYFADHAAGPAARKRRMDHDADMMMSKDSSISTTTSSTTGTNGFPFIYREYYREFLKGFRVNGSSLLLVAATHQ